MFIKWQENKKKFSSNNLNRINKKMNLRLFIKNRVFGLVLPISILFVFIYSISYRIFLINKNSTYSDIILKSKKRNNHHTMNLNNNKLNLNDTVMNINDSNNLNIKK